MNRGFHSARMLAFVLTSTTLSATFVEAKIEGKEVVSSFCLEAKDGFVTAGDGNQIYAWGYAECGKPMQYPGVTLLVKEGISVQIKLRNSLPNWAGNVSIEFPGHAVTAAGGIQGFITREAPPGGMTEVTYSFMATNPGTYLYHSGTWPDLQVEMGLVGAIVVRPSDCLTQAGCGHAYNHIDSAYDREHLFLLTEMDLRIHELMRDGLIGQVDTSDFQPVYWFINGRTAPDTMFEDYAAWLPSQPYSSTPRMFPGEKLLMRVIGAGRQLHPFHHHGAHARIIARDGRLLRSGSVFTGNSVFTIQSVPGETVDALFTWTGEKLGWDIYGTGPEYAHTCTDGVDVDALDDLTKEYCPDHGKPFPVTLPELQNLFFGGFWSGSPFLGVLGSLPPGEGGLNPTAGYVHMWHSHTEFELVNNDIFPGGMMTFLIIEPPNAGIIIE